MAPLIPFPLVGLLVVVGWLAYCLLLSCYIPQARQRLPYTAMLMGVDALNNHIL